MAPEGALLRPAGYPTANLPVNADGGALCAQLSERRGKEDSKQLQLQEEECHD